MAIEELCANYDLLVPTEMAHFGPSIVRLIARRHAKISPYFVCGFELA